MELSPQGTTLAWFGVAVAVVGVVFQNPLFIAPAIVIGVVFIFLSVSFRLQVNAFRRHLSIGVEPQASTTIVNSMLKFEVRLSNSSHVSVAVNQLDFATPSEIKLEVEGFRKRCLLPRGGFVTYSVLARPLSPGLFTVSSASMTVEDRSTLVVGVVRLRCNMTVEANPALAGPRVRLETSDPRRLGAGTEVAGLREAVTEDDFKVIDWKTTARMGRYMAKEFLQELIPPAIIAINKSALTPSSGSQTKVLTEVTRLMTSFAPSTRVGLIIFEEQKINANFMPTVGQRSMQQMISTLVTSSGGVSLSTPRELVTRSYSEIVNAVHVMKASIGNRPRRTIDVFTRSILPYYENALANYPSNLRKQGSFQALLAASKIQQPALVVLITGLNIDLSGVCEGSVILNQAGHRVIISVIASPAEAIPTELTRLRHLGILVLSTSGSELLNNVRDELHNTPRVRVQGVKVA